MRYDIRSRKFWNALKPITKPIQLWSKALTNAVQIAIVQVLNVVRGYLLTSLRRRNIGRRFKALFIEAFRGNGGAGRPGLTPENCGHYKGGGNRYAIKDYNVAAHTFPDGKVKIWCMNGCGFKSWNGDANWQQALFMQENTSNNPSSSERGFTSIVRKSEVTVVYQDKI